MCWWFSDYPLKEGKSVLSSILYAPYLHVYYLMSSEPMFRTPGYWIHWDVAEVRSTETAGESLYFSLEEFLSISECIIDYNVLQFIFLNIPFRTKVKCYVKMSAEQISHTVRLTLLKPQILTFFSLLLFIFIYLLLFITIFYLLLFFPIILYYYLLLFLSNNIYILFMIYI